MDAARTTITVARSSPADLGMRQIIMSVDGAPLGTLLMGQSVTRDIAPGHHRLRAYNTLVWKTIEFDVAPGQHVAFLVANRPGTLVIMGLLGVGPMYLTLVKLEV